LTSWFYEQHLIIHKVKKQPDGTSQCKQLTREKSMKIREKEKTSDPRLLNILQREFPSSSRVRPIIWFPSLKNAQSMYCDSKLERDYLIHLEFDESVERYVTQPLSIAYLSERDKPTRYTPDLLIKYVDSNRIYGEVKPFSRTQSHGFLRKISWLNDILSNSQDTPLKVITCKDFKGDKMILNKRMLYQYLPLAEREELAAAVAPFLKSSPSYSMAQFEAWTKRTFGKKELAWAYIAQNISSIELAKRKKLTRQSIIEGL